MMRTFLFALFASLAQVLFSAVEPGVWQTNYPDARAYAEANDLPLVMVWGRVGCGYCANLFTGINDSQFGCATWSANLRTTNGRGVIFCEVEGTAASEDVEPNIGAKEFAKGADTGAPLNKLPFICLYWKDRLTERLSGQDLPDATDESVGNSAIRRYLNSFESRVEEYLLRVPVEGSYAMFPMGDYPCDRLEAVVGITTYVDIPVVRTNALAQTATCRLRVGSGSDETLLNVSWVAQQSMVFVRYALPSGVSVGQQIPVILEELNGDVLAERNIWCIAEPENSPKNPYWIGEKTAETLAWGEWSMDIDAVTNKVKAYNAAHPTDRAYAMMFVGGSTWCPDCAMAEANFFSKQAFKDWAVAHKVVFGVLDIPNNPQAANASPSQLRYESSRASDAFVTLRKTSPANEDERYQSGAGYLSRHSVPYQGEGVTALSVAARNAFLMGHDTLNGGWNRPERSNKNRTGVPVLLLLRGDGSIAARWNRFSDVGPSAYSDGYLRRFEEMMALVDAVDEESDNDISTTCRAIRDGDQVSDGVSSIDQADVFSLADVEEDEVVRFRVTGQMSAPLSASIVDRATGTSLATETGLATDGVTVSAKLGSSTYFLKVAPQKIEDGMFFGYTNVASTVCGYTVAATSSLSGGEIGFVTPVTNVLESCGTLALKVAREKGGCGTASVKVRLTSATGEGVDERVIWEDQILTWADGEVGEKAFALKLVDDASVRHDLRLGLSLLELAGPAEDLRFSTAAMTVNVYDDEIFGVPVYRYVKFAEERALEGYVSGQVVLTLKRGNLPEGVRVSAADGKMLVSGCVLGEAGSYSAVYGVKAGSTDLEDVTLEFTVTDYDFAALIPSLSSTRTYDNLVRLEQVDQATHVLGLLTLTVPATGGLSAKYQASGSTFAYVTEGWETFSEQPGMLTAVLAGTDDASRTISVTLAAAGGLASFVDPTDGIRIDLELPATIWGKGAAAYRGQYTVQLPQTNIVDQLGEGVRAGAAYMALRMNDTDKVASGSMLYAGVLPNGRSFYGRRTLIEEVGEAVLPFYHASDLKSSGYAFSGGLALAPNAETKYKTERWSVSAAYEPIWAMADGFGHESTFSVFGGYYDCDEITARFSEDFKGQLDNFAFQADARSLVSGRYGLGRESVVVSAEMTSTNMPQLVVGVENPQQVRLVFWPATGVVSGELLLPFATKDLAVTFRGIALPGWQGCDTCASGFVERPWATGACSFSDRAAKTGVYRNGCEVRLDRFE